MRRALYASGSLHVALLLWVAVGGKLFDRSPETEFEVTGVTLMSVSEFEALTGAMPSPLVDPTLAALEQPALPQDVAAPAAEASPPSRETPAETQPPPPEQTPVPLDPIPDTRVTDEVAALASPPGAPDAAVTPTPRPETAPRVAPVAAPLPEPDVETAPEVLEQPTEPEVAEDVPVEETPDTAPEQATTEIVTEAEEAAAAPLGPTSSVRPTARPARPAPVAEPEEVAAAVEASAETATQAPAEAVDPLAAAIASAVADAVATPTPIPAVTSGPPLSQGVRDGFRVAVQACWNVGALSTEALGTTVVIAFDMARDARPDAGTIRMVEFSGGSQAAANQAYEAARRAIIRCGANGFDLPLESYDRWSQIELVFNPEGMRLR